MHELFEYKSRKANPDKFQSCILGNRGSHTLQINDITFKSTSSITILGITMELYIIRTGITCKKIPCYMHDSACRWFIY